MEWNDENGSLEQMEPQTDRYNEVFSKYPEKIDPEWVKSTVKWAENEARITQDREILIKLFNCIDLTSLKTTDNEDTILSLVEKVNSFEEAYPDLKPVASICVFPCYAGIVSRSLEVEEVRTCSVAGGFPSAQTFPEVKIAETSLALHDGAEEIDIVQNPGHILNGDYETIAQETDELKAVCGEKTLKVIIETSALGTLENVRKASLTALYCGADFIKTSTGKDGQTADPESFCVMCRTIREYADETGRIAGIKAAGGINTVKEALTYWNIAGKVLGKEWQNNNRFRIGTSRLANMLLSEITGKKCTHF